MEFLNLHFFARFELLNAIRVWPTGFTIKPWQEYLDWVYPGLPVQSDYTSNGMFFCEK